MFDLQLGEKLSINELYLRAITAPFLLIGNPGQGKSVFLIKFVLELIKNRQTGVLYDPYGDLVKKISEHLKSDGAREHVRIFNHDDNIDYSEATERFVLIRGDLFKEGLRASQSKAQTAMQSALSILGESDWLLVDEAFSMLTDDIFEAYLSSQGSKKVLSCQDFFGLSDEERKRLFPLVQGFFVYKPRNLDAKWLSEHINQFDVKSIAAIKQFHFQFLFPNGDPSSPEEPMKKPGYDTVLWPLEDI